MPTQILPQNRRQPGVGALCSRLPYLWGKITAPAPAACEAGPPGAIIFRGTALWAQWALLGGILLAPVAGESDQLALTQDFFQAQLRKGQVQRCFCPPHGVSGRITSRVGPWASLGRFAAASHLTFGRLSRVFIDSTSQPIAIK